MQKQKQRSDRSRTETISRLTRFAIAACLSQCLCLITATITLAQQPEFGQFETVQTVPATTAWGLVTKQPIRLPSAATATSDSSIQAGASTLFSAPLDWALAPVLNDSIPQRQTDNQSDAVRLWVNEKEWHASPNWPPNRANSVAKKKSSTKKTLVELGRPRPIQPSLDDSGPTLASAGPPSSETAADMSAGSRRTHPFIFSALSRLVRSGRDFPDVSTDVFNDTQPIRQLQTLDTVTTAVSAPIKPRFKTPSTRYQIDLFQRSVKQTLQTIRVEQTPAKKVTAPPRNTAQPRNNTAQPKSAPSTNHFVTVSPVNVGKSGLSPIRTNPFSVDSINQAKLRTEKQNRYHSTQNHNVQDSMTTAGTLPDASFYSEQFRRSVMEAFLRGDFNTSLPVASKTESLRQTVFDESYFRRSVEHSIQATDFELSPALKPPIRSVPNTGFDAYQFDLSVEQSLRSGDFRGPNTSRKRKLSVATGRALSTPLQGKMVAANSDQFILGEQQQLGPSQLSPPVRSNDLKKKSSPDTLNNRPSVKEELPNTFDHATGQAPSYHYNDFSPMPVDPASTSFDPVREAWPYDAKADVYTQHPLVEYPRKWYGNGITPHGIDWFGHKNLVRPQFYVYGDYRVGIQAGRNANGRADNVAKRLNLDLDLRLTDTERFHAFFGPLDKNGKNSRIELVKGELDLEYELDLNPATGFFEGDLGVILGASQNRTAPFDLPFTAGLVPLLFQNGIWLEDAASGAAFAIPAFSSRLLNWSNADATFFALFDQINSPAFSSKHSAQAFGTAWFIEAYDGYIETGYAYLNDRNVDERDYHNITFSYTRRYFDRISNSVRVIVNAGQDGDRDDRTADGTLLLVENSWITAKPLTVVPYANFFVGWDRPQSVARAGGSGGVLRNTGLNFQSDGLNGFSFLDDTGNDTAGGAIGVDLIGDQLDRQLILEAAWQTSHGSLNRNVSDDQFAVGARWQYNLSNATLLRFDTMYGWRRGQEDIYGTRLEYRWKF